MREYDRVDEIRLGRQIQIRRGIKTDRGEVTKFLLQLEYRLEHEWAEVVRFDHDSASEGGHDVTEEGLHMDIYRDGQKVETEDLFPSLPADKALGFAEEHLTEHSEQYIRRFEQWHDLNPR